MRSKENIKVAFIMRGLPGSGKSSIASHLISQGGMIHEVDQHFMRDGVFEWDDDSLLEVLDRNFEAFNHDCESGVTPLVYDYINPKRDDFERYIKAAERNGYMVAFVTTNPPSIDESVNRNIHYVPRDVVKSIIDRWDPITLEQTNG
jgi:predicted ABC-type ATPase